MTIRIDQKSNKNMSPAKRVLDKKQVRTDIFLLYQPSNDDFIKTISNIFRWTRWVGIVGLERFVWKLYGLTQLCIVIGIDSQAIWKVAKALCGWAIDTAGHRSVTARLAGTMFYTAVILAMIQCNRFCKSWKEISKYWTSIEGTSRIKHMPEDRTLKKRMYKISGILLFCALVVYVINAMSAINFHCKLSVCLKKIILKTHGFILLESEYSDWIGVLILFMSVTATTVWNLQDLIIILISIGLTSRYKRLNTYVATFTRKNNSKKMWCTVIVFAFFTCVFKDEQNIQVHTWRKIREAYVKQVILVRRVDSFLGLLILMSNFFNFYFICLQLYLGIAQSQKDPSKKSSVGIKHLNHLIHLIWLSGRTIFTVLSAADVHHHSRLALPYLYECRTEYYNIEIERLLKQLNKNYVALTGMGFFYINRRIIVQMAGIIITYVLVLVQYDGSDDQTLTNNTETSF